MMQKRQIPKQQLIFKKNAFEVESWSNQGVVCGIDEVGRGCLAGPLVTAAVIIPPHKPSRLLKDSKTLSEPERLKAYAWIMRNCWYGLGIVHHRLIDKHNIYQATLIAMKRALVNLLTASPHKPTAILVDAMPLELADTSYGGIPVHHFPFGERKSSSIAAASILAKVKRDALMTRLDAALPGYYLKEHKGYATAKHRIAITEHHASIIHRHSFLTNIQPHTKEHNESESQQSLC